MSKLIRGRLTVPASNIPKLYTLEPPTILPGYATQTGSRRQRAEDLLSVDDGDFLTRRLTLALEKGRLINADEILATRAAESLVDVGIVPWKLHLNFHLEHPSNLICNSLFVFEPCKLVLTAITVADGLHPLFNTYGAFAYVPSDATMDALLAIFKSRNEVLQQAINELDPWTSRKSRNLIESISPELWSTFTYEIAILLPDHFLPFKQELLIRDPTTPSISYIRTRIIDKELWIIPIQPDTESVIYPPFSHSTQRSGSDRVNPFFVLINATEKYERHRLKYGTGTMSPRVDALLRKAAMIVELIFAELEPAPDSFGAKLKAQREEEKKAEKDSREGGRQIRSRQEGGPTEAIEGDADGDVAFFDAITEELKKPGLSPKERVRLHMLQLFGGKNYETPHMPGVPDPPSVFDRISKGDYNAYESPASILLDCELCRGCRTL
ncbi:hypothetical protein BT96DRAFT_1021878 [Gymnopus androsaceus JB14]|uniref:Uncharacterized protein n=1 Tax=Gymnopus androsaceus JB14 TaxID=1447944 RepID=A0A6A4HCS8_9AGAR|nr:hypothetical protein BT96DRAFT_1021878 [Gymnopus androsaceus JB14]